MVGRDNIYVYIRQCSVFSTSALNVLSHNDRGVRALIIGGPLYSKHMDPKYPTPLKIQYQHLSFMFWTLVNDPVQQTTYH